jgi:hypothetical protein
MATAKVDPEWREQVVVLFFDFSNKYRVVNEGLYRTELRDRQSAVCIGPRDLSKPLHM